MTSKTFSTALLALSLTAATAAFAGAAGTAGTATMPASGSNPAKPAVKTTAPARQHHRIFHRRSASKTTTPSKTDAKKKDGKGY